MSAATASRRPARTTTRRRVEPIYYLYLLPALALFVLFVLGPAVLGILTSFTDYVGFGEWRVIGTANYEGIFSDPAILQAYAFTIGFALVSVILAQAIALALAVGLTARIRFSTTLRTVFIIPMVISGIVIAFVFNFLFTNSLPDVAAAVGFGPLETSILANPDLAWLSIVVVSVWQTIPGAMLVYIAGLLSIPGDITEASAIDGASKWRTFTSITLPLISGYVIINAILGVKGYLNAYDVIIGLTAGGPGTATRSVAMAIFSGFTGGDYAYQMANAGIFFVLTVLIALLQLAVTRGRNLSIR